MARSATRTWLTRPSCCTPWPCKCLFVYLGHSTNRLPSVLTSCPRLSCNGVNFVFLTYTGCLLMRGRRLRPNGGVSPSSSPHFPSPFKASHRQRCSAPAGVSRETGHIMTSGACPSMTSGERTFSVSLQNSQYSVGPRQLYINSQ